MLVGREVGREAQSKAMMVARGSGSAVKGDVLFLSRPIRCKSVLVETVCTPCVG